MTTTIIIEDEYPAAERLEKLLLKLNSPVQILAVIQSVSGALAWLAENPAPDLIFSDIQLSDGLSFQIFEEFPVKSPIIFTTSYDEYAIKAFKVKSIDYLLKPIKFQELQTAVHKFKEMQLLSVNDYSLKIDSLLDSLQTTGKRYKNRFLVKHHEQLVPIQKEEIAYFFTSNGLVCLVRRDAKHFLIDYHLEELEKLLEPSYFFRLNRQVIATLPAIQHIHTYFNGKLKLDLQPKLTQEVVVSREKVQAFKEWMEG
ncbi:LytR/AlgR family response regulator transcription factor [Adhaeribacter pallidiroseus]|uniref:Sensory transduction protein LytR n=1 Tax=Adhaeribacter pallidiroseus TaxID=2072847 RepID=A0A369QI12_9BACT|nr:LytTR family DNA-binding domain-containing protein [Adhaeribacter pallidiroseus]RDC61938.1 Sensory transduction protein LytR [Adhaeribacter pallidiroseus]